MESPISTENVASTSTEEKASLLIPLTKEDYSEIKIKVLEYLQVKKLSDAEEEKFFAALKQCAVPSDLIPKLAGDYKRAISAKARAAKLPTTKIKSYGVRGKMEKKEEKSSTSIALGEEDTDSEGAEEEETAEDKAFIDDTGVLVEEDSEYVPSDDAIEIVEKPKKCTTSKIEKDCDISDWSFRHADCPVESSSKKRKVGFKLTAEPKEPQKPKEPEKPAIKREFPDFYDSSDYLGNLDSFVRLTTGIAFLWFGIYLCLS